MAHDSQSKEPVLIFGKGMRVQRFDYPKKGERFWNRHLYQAQTADSDIGVKYLILEKEGE